MFPANETHFSLPPELHEAFRTLGVPKTLAKGTIVYEEGFPCPQVPLILSGSVRVFKMGETGREITLYRVEAGEICVLSSTCALAGESAHLPALAEAETDVEMLAIPVHQFKRLLTENPNLHALLNQVLTWRLAEMMMMVDEVAFGRLDLRLAERLVRYQQESGQTITVTHQQLAMELGSAREVISRVLKDFEKQGIVKLGRGKIDLLQVGRLQEMSARSA